MKTPLCKLCSGNGYYYDTALGEITGLCPQCDGAVTKKVRASNELHVELSVTVQEDADFTDSVRKTVESLGWSYDDYPVQSDYLLQLLIQFFDKYRGNGISLKSISVGKQVVHVRSVDLGNDLSVSSVRKQDNTINNATKEGTQ